MVEPETTADERQDAVEAGESSGAGDQPERADEAPAGTANETPDQETTPVADSGDVDAGPVPVEAPAASSEVVIEDLLAGTEPPPESIGDAQLKAVLEAIIYVTEEPLPLPQVSASLGQPPDRIRRLLSELMEEFDKPSHGIAIREVASGYKMATKPEHHEAVRNFVKSLKPPLKLSLAALETLAVIAYKQPVTGPEIMEIRGVQGAGVLKTLLDRKLIAVAGRKNVIGKPMLYKTTKDFLVQFGLKDLAELPSLKEFEEIRRMAFSDEPEPQQPSEPPAPPAGDPPPEPETPAGDPPPPEPSEA